MFEVTIMTVFLKIHRQPCPSVRRPSSEHFKESIENDVVCLLGLVDENDRIRTASVS